MGASYIYEAYHVKVETNVVKNKREKYRDRVEGQNSLMKEFYSRQRTPQTLTSRTNPRKGRPVDKDAIHSVSSPAMYNGEYRKKTISSIVKIKNVERREAAVISILV